MFWDKQHTPTTTTATATTINNRLVVRWGCRDEVGHNSVFSCFSSFLLFKCHVSPSADFYSTPPLPSNRSWDLLGPNSPLESETCWRMLVGIVGRIMCNLTTGRSIWIVRYEDWMSAMTPWCLLPPKWTCSFASTAKLQGFQVCRESMWVFTRVYINYVFSTFQPTEQEGHVLNAMSCGQHLPAWLPRFGSQPPHGEGAVFLVANGGYVSHPPSLTSCGGVRRYRHFQVGNCWCL